MLTIGLIQQHATPDIENNILRGEAAFEKAARQGAQCIAFAELAFTPFYPQHRAGSRVTYTESIPGRTTQIFTELARRHHVVTVLNLFEKVGDVTYDASPVIDADGTLLGVTRMVHILDAPYFHEKGYYAPGSGHPLIYDTKVGKIGIAICYDRHFPEYMRALGLLGAQLVVVPQAGSQGEWPPGIYEAELQIAGFQNGYFVALCNRIGSEECLVFEGKSFVTAPDGRIIAQAPAGEDHILIAEIDFDEIRDSHAHRYFYQDRRPDLYTAWLLQREQ